MAMYSRITTYPPLGQLTVISPEQEYIAITVIIEWDSWPHFQYDVCLAFTQAGTNQHESQWHAIPSSLSSNPTINFLNAKKSKRAIYTGSLSRQDLSSGSAASGHYLFTVKFRVDPYAAWQWPSVLEATAPGELVLQQPKGALENEDLLTKNVSLAAGWDVTAVAPTESKIPSARTFVLESKSAIPNTDDSAFATSQLALIPAAVRYFSVIRLEPYWIGPRQGKGSFFHLEEDSIASSFLLDNGLVLSFVVLGWLDDVYQVFRSDEQGGIVVAAQNDSGEERRYKVVLSIGAEIQDTMKSAMDQVRSIVASSTRIASLDGATKQITSTLDVAAAVKSNEEWIDSLSFCTWNALGQDLTRDKIMGALEQLQKNNIHIATLLIDDNWQSLDENEQGEKTFCDMRANTAVAPTGLKGLISDIRAKYPGIKDIGVWHALMGYWGGFSAKGSIAKDYQTAPVDAFLPGNKAAQVVTITPDVLHRFYDDFYAFLRDAGLTFVKTDAQHMLSMYLTSQGRRDLIATYQSAWTCAHLKYFGGKAISCMSQTPQTLFHSLLQTNTPAVVHRNSDDFYPELPTSHPWHVWVNAHNTHFTRHLNAVLDWDMFQTDHEYSAYHAAARCVSGGPILITDTPGKHNVKLLDEMTARAPGGRSIALRTSPGLSTKVFNLYTEESLLKIAASTEAGGASIAVFNVREREVRDVMHISEFSWPDNSVKEVLVRGHRTGEIFGPLPLTRSAGTTGANSDRAEEEMRGLIHIWLNVRGWDILTAQPVHRIETAPGSYSKICVLGLMGKMSGAAAITSSSISADSRKANIRVGLKALGRLGVWFDGAASTDKVEAKVQGSVVEAGFFKLVALPEHGGSGGDDTGRRIVDTGSATGTSVSMPHVWEIDVEAFWKQQAMWDEACKEVVVELVVG